MVEMCEILYMIKMNEIQNELKQRFKYSNFGLIKKMSCNKCIIVSECFECSVCSNLYCEECIEVYCPNEYVDIVVCISCDK